MFDLFRNRRRQKLRATPLPEGWAAALAGTPYYRALPPERQRELDGHIQVFMAEKRFEGCNGLEVDDAIAMAVAAHACALLLNRDTAYYPGLVSVLVYPGAFLVERDDPDELGVVDPEADIHEGESWDVGALVLSWEDARQDMARFDGRNVLFHEFAHQLWDHGDDGINEALTEDGWVAAYMAHYEEHCEAVDTGQPVFLDDYGAEDPAEFFSVATEAFFERPRLLHRMHPELFALLQQCYKQDPREYRL